VNLGSLKGFSYTKVWSFVPVLWLAGWTERLIFAIGVSVGAMGMVLRCDAEVKELRELLAEAQEQVQTLMHELEKLGGFVSEQQGVQTQCQLFMVGIGCTLFEYRSFGIY
jgi:hypothetical protein